MTKQNESGFRAFFSKNFWKDPLNVFTTICAVVLVFSGIPQAIQLFATGNVEGVSLATWFLVFFGMFGQWLRAILRVKDPVFSIQLTLSILITLAIILEIVYLKYFV